LQRAAPGPPSESGWRRRVRRRGRWQPGDLLMREDLALIGVGGITLALTLVGATALRGTTAATAITLVVVFAPSVVGTAIWRLKRRSWSATASWSLPLVVWMSVVGLSHALPPLFVGIGIGAGLAFAVVMIGSDDIADEWEERVLKRDPRSRGEP
jgi:uncharacterized membrane protein YfcA